MGDGWVGLTTDRLARPSRVVKLSLNVTRKCCNFYSFYLFYGLQQMGLMGMERWGEKNLFEVFPRFTCFVSPSLLFTEEIKEKTAWYRT